MSEPGKYYVLAEWDAEAHVWYVSDTNVPGLSLEGDTEEILLKKLDAAVPELLELNGVMADTPSIPYQVMVNKLAEARAH